MANVINWFEIPVKDFDRASNFYGKVLGGVVQLMDGMTPVKMGFLPGYEQGNGIGGAIVQGDGYEPTQTGSLVYLNGGEDLATPLAKVEEAGGQVVMPKTHIGEAGFIAQFIDSEGNKVAFHSMN